MVLTQNIPVTYRKFRWAVLTAASLDKTQVISHTWCHTPMTSPDDASLSSQLLEGVAEEVCLKVQGQPEQLRDALSQRNVKELGMWLNRKALSQDPVRGWGVALR